MIAMAEYFVATAQWIRLFCRVDNLFINWAVKENAGGIVPPTQPLEDLG